MNCKCGHDKPAHSFMPSDGVEKMGSTRNCRKCGCQVFDEITMNNDIKDDGAIKTPVRRRTVYEWATDEGLTQQSLINDLQSQLSAITAERDRFKTALEQIADRAAVREFWKRYCADENIIAVEVFKEMFGEPMFNEDL